MRIGELAKRTDIKIDTVRYYEKVGLLPPPPRRLNGYRDYGMPHLERLAFIRHCRALNMPLEDIRQLFGLLDHPEADCEMANCLIDEQLGRVRERMASLRTLERQLQALSTQCSAQASAGECGILRELVSASHNEGCVCHPSDSGNQGKTHAGSTNCRK